MQTPNFWMHLSSTIFLRLSHTHSVQRSSSGIREHPNTAAQEQHRGALHLHKRPLEDVPQEGGVCL